VEGGALLEADFVALAKEVTLFCHITSRLPNAPDPDLLQQKGGRGFPTFAILDSDGELLVKHEGPRTVPALAGSLQRGRDAARLRKKAEGGDAEAAADWLVHRARLGQIKRDDALRILEGLKLSEERSALIRLQVEFEVGSLSADEAWETLQKLSLAEKVRKELEERINNRAVSERLRHTGRDLAKIRAAGKSFAGMLKSGRIPTGTLEWPAFWRALAEYAQEEKEATLLERALRELETKFGTKASQNDWFRSKRSALDELKKKGV